MQSRCQMQCFLSCTDSQPRTTHTTAYTRNQGACNNFRQLSANNRTYANNVCPKQATHLSLSLGPKLLLAKHFRDAQVLPNEFQMQANRAAKHKQQQQQQQRRQKGARLKDQKAARSRNRERKNDKDNASAEWERESTTQVTMTMTTLVSARPRRRVRHFSQDAAAAIVRRGEYPSAVAPMRHTQSLNDDVDIFVFGFFNCSRTWKSY